VYVVPLLAGQSVSGVYVGVVAEKVAWPVPVVAGFVVVDAAADDDCGLSL
jgi:hypothetical protein